MGLKQWLMKRWLKKKEKVFQSEAYDEGGHMKTSLKRSILKSVKHVLMVALSAAGVAAVGALQDPATTQGIIEEIPKTAAVAVPILQMILTTIMDQLKHRNGK
jgi:hypothetical protein